ncbi:hypothetical protein GCM10009742_41090 [Kribbella karoonensis]|uniref:Uncharacterized protein n=1 Tax=Kribbella karoonensis TaxID=324851 RepID=A0ABN2E1C5_9ACTN
MAGSNSPAARLSARDQAAQDQAARVRTAQARANRRTADWGTEQVDRDTDPAGRGTVVGGRGGRRCTF